MNYSIFSKKAWLFHAFFIFCFSIAAQTSPVWVENFEYPEEDEIGNHGWVFENGNPYLKVCPGLTFESYAGSGIGNGLRIEDDGEAARHTFPQISEGNVYVSFLVQFNSNFKSQYFFTLWDGNMPSWAGGTDTKFAFNGRIYCENNSDLDTQLNIGLSFYNNQKSIYTTNKPVIVGNTYLLVIKYEIVPGKNNDKVSLYLLDHVSNQEPNEPILGPLSDNVSKGDISPAGLMFRPSHTGQDIVVDGIRVGTTWDSVVTSTSSGISTEPVNPTMKIGKDSQSIFVTLSKDEQIDIYNATGQFLFSVKGHSGINRIPLFNQGLFFITAGSEKGKIFF